MKLLLLYMLMLLFPFAVAFMRIPMLQMKRFAAFVPIASAMIPMELEDKLDSSRNWDVKFIFKGEEKIVSVCEDTSLLEMGESIFDGVDSSCRSGICTTCAGKIMSGVSSTAVAHSTLDLPELPEGCVCTCQCYVTGPGVTVRLGINAETGC